jgi:predicted XRE-type DNA-binding protein
MRLKKNPISEHRVFVGSTNIFADLGRPDAQEAFAKMKLAYEISTLIKSAGWTQAQAAKKLGIDQPKISALLRGRLSGFSIERLFRFLNQLGQEIQITVRPSKHPSTTVQVFARKSA